MSDWVEVNEDGTRFWLHDTFGNVMELKAQDGSKTYVAQFPKIIQLGPFASPEEAQSTLMSNRTAIDLLIQNFNQSLVQLNKELGGGDPSITPYVKEAKKFKEDFEIKVTKQLKDK